MLARKEFNRDFFLKNILLPVGAVGLGIFAAKKLSDCTRDDGNQVEHDATTVEEASNGWFPKLILATLPFLQLYFLSAKASEPTDGTTSSEERHGQQAASDAGWLSTLIPIAIPLAQQYFLKKSAQENEHSIDGTEVLDGTITKKKDAATVIFESLYKLLPVVLLLVQQYFSTKSNNHKTSENGQRYEVAA